MNELVLRITSFVRVEKNYYLTRIFNCFFKLFIDKFLYTVHQLSYMKNLTAQMLSIKHVLRWTYINALHSISEFSLSLKICTSLAFKFMKYFASDQSTSSSFSGLFTSNDWHWLLS